MKFIRRFLFRRKTLADLERGSWQNSISAAYSESVIPELEKLMEAERKTIEGRKEKIAELEQSPTYGARQERKALEKEIEMAETKLREYEKQVEAVRREAVTFRAQASEKLARREFFKQVLKKECK